MSEEKLNKKNLINKLTGFKVVSTESGPIVPAKTEFVKADTDGVMPPVGDQMSEDWDRRIYSLNKPICDNEWRKTVKDIYRKVLTEAATETPFRGMRLNLDSINLEETHCKIMFQRNGEDYIAEIIYPNAKGRISVIVKDQYGQTDMFETDIDSEEYMTNFGYTILKTVDNLRAKRKRPGSFNEMMGFGEELEPGTASATPLDVAEMEPSALLHESVGWELERDMRGTKKILMEFGPDDFAAEPVDGGDASQDIGAAIDAGSEMTEPVPGQETPGGDVEEIPVSYSDYAANRATIIKGGITDHMAEVIASSADDTPIVIGMDKQLNGFPGIKDQSDMSIINAFGKMFGFISDAPLLNPDQIAPERGDDVRLPESKWDEVFAALEDGYTTPEHFKEELGRILPDLFGNGSSPTNGVVMGNLELPSEDEFGQKISDDEPYTMAEPAPAGEPGEEDFGTFLDRLRNGEGDFQPDESEPPPQTDYDKILANIS